MPACTKQKTIHFYDAGHKLLLSEISISLRFKVNDWSLLFEYLQATLHLK